MNRLKLLLLIAAFATALVAVIALSSPVAPVVGGPVEIEALWAIEDARQESEAPLVTALENHGVPLAYDKNENTFYCPLGLETGDEWPELHLTAPGAQGVNICFSDDYTYDWCSDAISEGYSYELMAYSETEYSYFYIVFTGLPVVSIQTSGEITIEESGAHLRMGTDSEGLDCDVFVRLRGDGSLYGTEKLSYRIAFSHGRRNGMREVPGMGTLETVNLVAMAFDGTMMHDKLSWDMIGLTTPQDGGFAARKTQYVELFVDNEYQGVYLMMEPIDYETEIGKSGSSALLTDALYRTAVIDKVRSNEVIAAGGETGYELFYAPGTGDPFAQLQDFITLRTTEDDEEFARLALERIDMDSIMRYVVLLQAGGMVDNVQNNLFIWAHHENGRMRYRFLPWDMDRSWGMNAGSDYQHWSVFSVADRMLSLDVGGARRKLYDTWLDMKEKGFNYETIEALVRGCEHELNDSGAAMRNAYRWGTPIADGSGILDFSRTRLALFERVLESMLSAEGEIGFLSDELYNPWYIYVDMREE